MSNRGCTPNPETERTETERRLQDVLDRSEIADLVARSPRPSTRAASTTCERSTEDIASSAPGGQAQGRDAIVAQVSRNHTPERRSQHLVGDVIVDLDEPARR